MISDSMFFAYLGVILLAILGGLYNLRYRDTASKILLVLLCLTLASELASHLAAIRYQNNMFVYHFFAPVQLIIIGLYFDSINNNKRSRIGMLVGVLGIAVAIVNNLFFQSIKVLNSNFLLFEGLMIMTLALFSFQRILSNDSVDIFRYKHFWVIVVLIFFWSITYTAFALYSVLRVKKLFVMPFVTYLLWAVNIITYAAIGFVLLYFSGNGSKKQLAHE